jgi:hypothetical protein
VLRSGSNNPVQYGTNYPVITDENAFGILVSYFRVEDEEYGLERREFVDRFELFRRLLRECLRDVPLGIRVRAVDLGHALYVELAEDEHATSPLAWAKKAREKLGAHSLESVAIVTHGSRWVDVDAETFLSTEYIGDTSLVTISNPSEPLRRALYGEAAAHSDETEEDASGDSERAWGPGLYLDTEAAEALALAPKNAPTVLYTRGAGFYRVGR